MKKKRLGIDSRKTERKYHVPETESGIFSSDTDYEDYLDNPGTGDGFLDEPVPKYDKRSSDLVIHGGMSSLTSTSHNNNATIILGRDRNPFGPPRPESEGGGSREYLSKNPTKNSKVSGYSDFMGAGAIDIVVGRGAPFPIENPAFDKGYASLPPLYTTRTPPDLADYGLRDGHYHPGYIMDAARIYISQMCDIDEYFKIAKVNERYVFGRLPVKAGSEKRASPSSAIMVKADKIRMHSRRDIKIIAGGDGNIKYDSNGFLIESKGSIHLMSGNVSDYTDGEAGPSGQQPIVLGNNLIKLFNEVLDSIDDVLELVNNFATSQKRLNDKVSNQMFGTAAGPTTKNPISQTMNVIKQISDMKDQIQVCGTKLNNLPELRKQYLIRAGKFYINSKYHTVN